MTAISPIFEYISASRTVSPAQQQPVASELTSARAGAENPRSGKCVQRHPFAVVDQADCPLGGGRYREKLKDEDFYQFKVLETKLLQAMETVSPAREN